VSAAAPTNASSIDHPYTLDFWKYAASTSLATVAMQIQSVALAWQVYDLTRSPLALGYVGLFQFLPLALFTLPAGDLADRVNRRAMLVASFLVQAVCASALVILTLGGTRRIVLFYVVLAVLGAARAFASPPSQSILPRLVAEEHFPRAVAMVSSYRKIAEIAGPALGGIIYLLGAAFAYGVVLVLLASGAVLIALLASDTKPPEAKVDSSGFERVIGGLIYIWRNPVVLGAISLDLFAVLLGGATAMLPIYARDILEVGPIGLGLLRSAPGLGAAVLGIHLARRPPDRRVGTTMFVCVALFGVATIVFGISRSFLLSMCTLGALGAFDMVSVCIRLSLVQLATPDEMRGRVSAVNYLFIGASNELGEFESGFTAAWFGTVASVVVGGIGTLAVVGLWMLLFPALRKIDRLSEVIPA